MTKPAASRTHLSTAVDAYDPAVIEPKWRQRWEKDGLYTTPLDNPVRPFYNLMMFPYPSAEGLHIGHVFTFSGADMYGRYRRMKGDTVFEPMGFDAFGIHSENYALKIGEHPKRMMQRAVHNFRENQLKKMGLAFDWSHEVNTSDPSYYKWTQWLFLQLFDAGLAEQREGPVTWCPSCLTVLADEQVDKGRCERCESVVEQRTLKQWMLKITKYAQPLLDALDTLDWAEKTKAAQRNWIGRSEGALVHFQLQGCAKKDVAVFTTRPDTLYGATFLVVGADNPQLDEFVAPHQRDRVEKWLKSLPSRTGTEPDWSDAYVGMELGSEAIHPLTDEKIPVWTSTYVLGGYGTGAIMAVPAHDQRDWQFARAHDVPIVEVISGGDVEQEAYTGHGMLVNSGDFDGLDSDVAMQAIISKLTAAEKGEASVQYRLRDWLVSRQRYWGPPIPIIHCPTCGPVGVPIEQLPVVLPDVEEFRPLGTGVSPLAAAEEWVNVPCPRCGAPAKRETDVLDTFVDSSWYFLRYPSTEFDDRPMDEKRTKTWLPVDMYIGGQEHAVRHLLYARFVMRALYDLGKIPVPEPFTRFRTNGMIILSGAKMSKSKGNVINPDEYLTKYGADAMRLYMVFLAPFSEGGEFQDEGIRGITRFLDRVWRSTQAALGVDNDNKEKEQRRHRMLARIDRDMEEIHYNTAIAALMEFVGEFDKEASAGTARRIDAETLLQALAPLAPHIAEELWHRLGHKESIHTTQLPVFDPALTLAEDVTVAIQVNGKLRDTITVPRGLDSAELERRATSTDKMAAIIAARSPQRIITIADRVVNVVL